MVFNVILTSNCKLLVNLTGHGKKKKVINNYVGIFVFISTSTVTIVLIVVD